MEKTSPEISPQNPLFTGKPFDSAIHGETQENRLIKKTPMILETPLNPKMQ